MYFRDFSAYTYHLSKLKMQQNLGLRITYIYKKANYAITHVIYVKADL